jgi:hypothetical protein
MNEESQRRKILRFLKGKGTKDVDVFCLYQWVERCHYHGWWKLGIQTGTAIPPNSLKEEYSKRLNYLLAECRNNLHKDWAEGDISEAPIIYGVVRNIAVSGAPERLELEIPGKYEEWLPSEKGELVGLLIDHQTYLAYLSHGSNQSLWYFLTNWFHEDQVIKQTEVLKRHGFEHKSCIKLSVIKRGSLYLYVVDREE